MFVNSGCKYVVCCGSQEFCCYKREGTFADPNSLNVYHVLVVESQDLLRDLRSWVEVSVKCDDVSY